MRQIQILFSLVTISLVALIWSGHVGGAPSSSEEVRLKIVPVVMLKPGGKAELLMSTACTLGITRGGGLDVREMDPKGSSLPNLNGKRSWVRDGLAIEVPDFTEGPKQAASPKFAALAKANLNAFTVKISASSETKPGLYNMHLADSTCNGHCQTDFRVLVVTE